MELEMKPLNNVEIFSIAIGNLGSGLQYQVGQRLTISGKQAVITSIIRDENSYEFYGEIPYMIFASIDGEEKLIKAFVNQPVYISAKI